MKKVSLFYSLPRHFVSGNSPNRGITYVSARRTGTEHLIPNAFCVLNYTYVYRDKNALNDEHGLRFRGRAMHAPTEVNLMLVF